jgi:hypothetical protein
MTPAATRSTPATGSAASGRVPAGRSTVVSREFETSITETYLVSGRNQTSSLAFDLKPLRRPLAGLRLSGLRRGTGRWISWASEAAYGTFLPGV